MTSDFWSWDRFDNEARRLYDLGEYDAARELLEEGLALYPESAELRVSLGYAELAREEFVWARRRFAEALELEPDHEEGLVGMAEALLKFGERGRALLVLRRLVELGFDEDADLMLSAGRALHREGLWDRATDYFRRALVADPECAEAAAELAYARHRLGDAGAARRWCRRALELDPDLHEARAFYANLLYERGHLPAALVEFEKIPPAEMWDAAAAWRTVELLRRLRDLPEDDPRLAPYLERLGALAVDPAPEDRVLAEVAERAGDLEAGVAPDGSQLELFAWSRVPAHPANPSHRVSLPDGRVYEGDWEGIVRAMRDDSAEPDLPLAEFLAEEARRIHNLTGRRVPRHDAYAFLAAAARLGILRIER